MVRMPFQCFSVVHAAVLLVLWFSSEHYVVVEAIDDLCNVIDADKIVSFKFLSYDFVSAIQNSILICKEYVSCLCYVGLTRSPVFRMFGVPTSAQPHDSDTPRRPRIEEHWPHFRSMFVAFVGTPSQCAALEALLIWKLREAFPTAGPAGNQRCIFSSAGGELSSTWRCEQAFVYICSDMYGKHASEEVRRGGWKALYTGVGSQM